MNRKKLILIGVALIAVVSLAVFFADRAKKSGAPEGGSLDPRQRPSAAKLNDSAFVIDGELVEMTDGYSIVLPAPESTAAIVTRFFGAPVMADLDGDADLDAALLLTVNSPGSGSFYYVAASILADGAYRGTNAILLGDRVAPQALEVREGVIIANYAERKPGEPLTARPSVGASKYLRVEGAELKETTKP